MNASPFQCSDGFHSFKPLVEERDQHTNENTPLVRQCEACGLVVDDWAQLQMIKRILKRATEAQKGTVEK